jgi:hypothetical protein
MNLRGWDSQKGDQNGQTKLGHQTGTPNRDTKLEDQTGRPNWETKLGDQTGRPNRETKPGAKLGDQTGRPNGGAQMEGPKLGIATFERPRLLPAAKVRHNMWLKWLKWHSWHSMRPNIYRGARVPKQILSLFQFLYEAVNSQSYAISHSDNSRISGI